MSSADRCRSFLIPTALTVLLTACGGGGDNNTVTDPGTQQCGDLGSGSTSVTGGVSLNISGCSFFGTDVDGGSSYFSLFVVQGELASPVHVLWISREGTRPAAGTYSIDDVDFSANLSTSNPDRTFVFTSGTVTISSSSAIAMSGSFTGTAEELGGSAVVNISGSFSSTCSATTGLTC